MPIINSIKDKVQIIIIYCQEAHAIDEWPIGSSYKIKQHKNLEERFIAGNKFIENFDYDGTVLIDKMNNIFQNTFSSWPTKYYIINDGILEYISHPNKSRFDIEQLKE